MPFQITRLVVILLLKVKNLYGSETSDNKGLESGWFVWYMKKNIKSESLSNIISLSSQFFSPLYADTAVFPSSYIANGSKSRVLRQEFLYVAMSKDLGLSLVPIFHVTLV